MTSPTPISEVSVEDVREKLRNHFMTVQRFKREGVADSTPITKIVNMVPAILALLDREAEFRADVEAEDAESRALTAEKERDEALKELCHYAREAGEAKGRLEMSEAAGVVDGWRERAEKAERERDEALARVREVEGERDKARQQVESHERAMLEYRRRWARHDVLKRIDAIRTQIAGLRPGDAEALAELSSRILHVEEDLEAAEARAEALQAQVEGARKLAPDVGGVANLLEHRMSTEGDPLVRENTRQAAETLRRVQAVLGEAEPAAGPSQGSRMTYNGGVEE